MHTHACPLYSLAKLLGVEFTETGVSLSPGLPLEAFRFESPLLGIAKSARGYEGWYSPLTQNTWRVRIKLPADEAKRFSRAQANGERFRARVVDGAIEIRGLGGGGTPMRWSLSR